MLASMITPMAGPIIVRGSYRPNAHAASKAATRVMKGNSPPRDSHRGRSGLEGWSNGAMARCRRSIAGSPDTRLREQWDQGMKEMRLRRTPSLPAPTMTASASHDRLNEVTDVQSPVPCSAVLALWMSAEVGEQPSKSGGTRQIPARAARGRVSSLASAPGRIRTYDLRLRRPLLYPAELLAPSRSDAAKSGRPDSNWRPLAPKASALPG